MDVVDEQLAAYNARDADRFAACYAPDCVVEDGEGRALMRGRDEVRRRYAELFAASPSLHARVVHRAVVGRYVVDEERIVGREGAGEVHAVVVYRVADGLIATARILR